MESEAPRGGASIFFIENPTRGRGFSSRGRLGGCLRRIGALLLNSIAAVKVNIGPVWKFYR